MLNLGAVLLQLCQPFCSTPDDPKSLKIDPTYGAVIVSNFIDINANNSLKRKMIVIVQISMLNLSWLQNTSSQIAYHIVIDVV